MDWLFTFTPHMSCLSSTCAHGYTLPATATPCHTQRRALMPQGMMDKKSFTPEVLKMEKASVSSCSIPPNILAGAWVMVPFLEAQGIL